MPHSTDKPTEIALFIPSLLGGGAERVGVNFVNELARLGILCDIVVGDLGQADLLNQVDSRVGIHNLGQRRIRSYAWPLLRYLVRNRPRTLVASMWPLPVIALLARFLPFGIQVYAWEHCAEASRKNLLWRSLAMLSYRALHGRLAVSQGLARAWERWLKLPTGAFDAVYNPCVQASNRVEAAPHPLPPEAIQWMSGNSVNLLAIGSLKPEKNYESLVQALSYVDSRWHLKLLIAGSGNPEALLKLAREKGCAHRLLFCGYVADIQPLLQAADRLVLSSVSEGLPTVLIEALNAGVPCISTDCNFGPREILILRDLGELVEVRNPQALARAIETSLERKYNPEQLKASAQRFEVRAMTQMLLSCLGRADLQK